MRTFELGILTKKLKRERDRDNDVFEKIIEIRMTMFHAQTFSFDSKSAIQASLA